MRRLWFKKEMQAAIIAGRKRATTRIMPLKVGETYQAVSGLRFNAERFARLRITSRREIDDLTHHCTIHFEAEGFDSPMDMATYIRNNLKQYLLARPLYYHTFRLV